MKSPFFLILSFFLLSFRGAEQEVNLRYGILTDDFGIVTEDDILENAKQAYPRNNYYPYEPNLVWQCLPLEKATLSCDYLSYDDEGLRYTCDPTLRIVDGDHLYEFFVRHIFDVEDYKDIEHRIQTLFLNEVIGCISAYYEKEEKTESNSPFRRHSIWTLDRIKSRKGIWSYFSDDSKMTQ